MGNSKRYEFTPEQQAAIGQLVVDKWGGNITQSGIGINAIPYIAFQMTPNGRVYFYDIYPDGTVVAQDD